MTGGFFVLSEKNRQMILVQSFFIGNQLGFMLSLSKIIAYNSYLREVFGYDNSKLYHVRWSKEEKIRLVKYFLKWSYLRISYMLGFNRIKDSKVYEPKL